MKKGSLLLTFLVIFIIIAVLPSPPEAADKNGVSPNTISLPSGPGSIEGLGGAFQPMLNTGMASYEVDMTLPAGVNGHIPRLSLRYNSGLGDGPAGIGWHFRPGSISRQTEKGIPRYVDGPNGLDDDHDGLTDETDELDTFIGFEGEEIVRVADGTYRARIEGVFIRYRRIGDHWEANLKNGTKLEFGLTSSGRITDPTGTKIYRWLLEKSTDMNGNIIQYIYISFSTSDNQKYLQEICYGPGAPPWQAYYFASLTYEDRPDWRKDYRSGFLIKTTKRLARVHIGIQGESPSMCKVGDWNKDGTPDALIRSYTLSYKDNNYWSYLSEVTRYGSDGVNYLPPVSFSYSTFDPNITVSARDAIMGSINEPSSVMDSQLMDLADLNRDGLPDLLKTDLYGGRHTCYLNLGIEEEGSIQWDHGKDIGSEDGLALLLYLSESRVHLADMDGDGISDLVYNDNIGEVHYFQNQGDLSWARKKQMSIQDTSPPAPFVNPQVRSSDLDFDKRIDIVKSSENGYSIWFNLEEGKYSREVRTAGAVCEGEVIPFSGTGVHLADMNGDRMNDVARVTPTQVIYCANMGHGHFDSCVSIPIPEQVLTDGPNGQVIKARLKDINGDGLSDLVIERAGGNELWYWLNLGTDTFTHKHTLTDMPASYGYNMVTRWADINGNGTTDLIYADSSAIPRLRALDIGELVGGSDHPNMLTAIDNGMGVITRIYYKSSTAYYLNARKEEDPWSSMLPFPVSVVARVETTPSLDLDGVPGKDIYVKEYVYRDGYYDDLEKTFRGFVEATVIEHGDDTAPTQVTNHLFFTGGPDGLDNDNDGIKDEVSPEGYREDEPLKGMIREIEVRSEDDILYTKEENIWEIRTLFTNQEGIEVRFAYSPEKGTHIFEGTTAPETLKSTFLYDDYGNIIEEKDYGALSITGDEVFTYTTYIYNTQQWILNKYSTQHKTDADGQKVAEIRRHYDGAPFIGLESGFLEKGNLSREEGWVEEDKYVSLVRNRFDAYGNIIGIMDGNENLREIRYDDLLNIFPVQEIIHVGADIGELIFKVAYNLGHGAISQSTDFNGNTTSYKHDCFGRMVKIIKPGDSSFCPTQFYLYTISDPNRNILYSYDEEGTLTLKKGASLPSSVMTKAREESGKEGTFDSIQFMDGMKRKLAKLEEAEEGFIVKEAALFNARGKSCYRFLPYQVSSFDYQTPSLSNPHIEISYDAIEREILHINPKDQNNIHAERHTQYLPLEKRVIDENHNIKIMSYDGLERQIEVREMNKGEVYITRYEYNSLDKLTKITDAQNNVKTIYYDGLGRKKEMRDPDRGRILYEYDDAGNLVKTIDNKGQVVLYNYDGANRILTEDYLDGAGISPDVSYRYDIVSVDYYPDARNVKGALSWVTDLSGAQFFSYDKRGNTSWTVKRIIHNGSITDYITRVTYDAMDRTTSTAYPDGDKVSYIFNNRSLLTSIPGIIRRIDYTEAEKFDSISYANGVRTQYNYDDRQRLIHLETKNTHKPDSILQHLSYHLDNIGNITAITDDRPFSQDSPQNATQTFLYDDLYRLVRAQGPGYGLVQFEYDRIGNMTLKKTPDATDPLHIHDPLINLGAMGYGGLGGSSNRKAKLPGEPPGPHAITRTESGLAYEYDDNGNMVRHANGGRYTWDFKDRLIRVQKDGVDIHFIYDYSGERIVKSIYENSSENTTRYVSKEFEIRDGKKIKYIFAGDRRIARIEGDIPAPDTQIQQTLSFYPGWNYFSLEVQPDNPSIEAVLGIIAGNDAEIWGFNPLTDEFKGYVPKLGICDLTELHAQEGYLIKVETETHLTVSGRGITDSLSLSVGWNLISCPSDAALSIEEALSSIAGKYQSVWAYDTQVKQWRFYNPGELSFLNELTQMEPGRAYWINMKENCILPFVHKLETNIYFFHPDHLGSSNIITDINGEVVASTEYYPFGRSRYEDGQGFEASYKYTGKELDIESGLIYSGARYYEPVLGRFINPDPLYINEPERDLGNPQKLNLYIYVNNNPINLIDPYGLDWKDWDLRWAADFSSGFANVVTFGGVGWIQGKMGVRHYVNEKSGCYKWGKGTGYVWWAVVSVHSAGQNYMALQELNPHTMREGIVASVKTVKALSKLSYSFGNLCLAIANVASGEKPEKVPGAFNLLKDTMGSELRKGEVDAIKKLGDALMIYWSEDDPSAKIKALMDMSKDDFETAMKALEKSNIEFDKDLLRQTWEETRKEL